MAEPVFSPELVLVCPELRDAAFAQLEEPWLVQNRPALAPAAERRAVRSFRARWPLVGVFLLFANLLGAAWNLGVLSLAQDVWKPSGRATAADRPPPVASPARDSNSVGVVAGSVKGQRRRLRLEDSEREESVGRSRVHRRRRVFVAWRALPGRARRPLGHSLHHSRVLRPRAAAPNADRHPRAIRAQQHATRRPRPAGGEIRCRRSCARHDHNEWERLCEERSLRGQDLLALRIESTLPDHCVDQEVRRECCRGREEPCLTAVGEFSDDV